MRGTNPRSWRLIVTTAGALASACAEPPAVGVVDSAGVAIVTSVRAAWGVGDGWVVDSGPLQVIGATDSTGPASLQVVVGAMRQSDGTIVVADNGASQLKVFAPDGSLRQVIGRKGTGPGEFEYLAYLWACGGDSAFVEDVGRRRVTVFDPAGHEARAFELKGPEGNAAFSTTCNRRGDILTTGWGDMRNAGLGPHRPVVKVAFASRDGRATQSLGAFPGTEMVRVPWGGYPRPAGRWLRIAMGEGLAWIAANEDRDVQGYDLQGRLRRVIRRPGEEPPFTAADRDMVERLVVDSLRTERERKSVREELARNPLPEGPPAVVDLRTDALGNVWVRSFPRAEAANPWWSVYAPDGGYQGDVRMPDDVQVLEIGRDYVLALRNDPDLGHLVLVYSLRR